MQEDQAVMVNGLCLRYRISGTGRPMIVQAPGWGIGAHVYEQTLAPLAEHCMMISYDTRGSGGSERPARAEDATLANMVEDLEELRRQLGLETFALMGHSHGGSIALAYAARYGQQLSQLILLDTPVNDAGVGADLERTLPQLAAREETAQAATVFMSELASITTDEEMAAVLEQIMPLYFADVAKSAPIGLAVRACPPSSWAYRAISHEGLFDVGDQLAAWSVPTLVVVGRHDFICSPAQAQQLHERIGSSQLVIFEQSGHFPWLEEPDAFFGAVTAFLQLESTRA